MQAGCRSANAEPRRRAADKPCRHDSANEEPLLRPAWRSWLRVLRGRRRPGRVSSCSRRRPGSGTRRSRPRSRPCAHLGAHNGFAVDANEDAGDFTHANLKRYDAVVFLMTTGDVLDDAQQAAFQRFIRAGGGWVGVHSAAGHRVRLALVRRPDRRVLQRTTRRFSPQCSMSPIRETGRRRGCCRRKWLRTDEWYNFQSKSAQRRSRCSRRSRSRATTG